MDLPQQALEGDADAPPTELEFRDALARLQSTSPEVATAMSEIGRARAALERARVEPISNVSVQGLINVVDNDIGGKPDVGVAIWMPIPVFNRNQGGVRKAQHEIAAAEQALQQLELGMQTWLAPIFERYANARNQVERYREAILPAAQESLDLTRKMYEAGKASFLSSARSLPPVAPTALTPGLCSPGRTRVGKTGSNPRAASRHQRYTIALSWC